LWTARRGIAILRPFIPNRTGCLNRGGGDFEIFRIPWFTDQDRSPVLVPGALFFAGCGPWLCAALRPSSRKFRGYEVVGGFYEKVDVPRKAGLRVIDNGIASDNEVSNAMGMEGGQKGLCILGTSSSISQPFMA
jgi:hypothetical protein